MTLMRSGKTVSRNVRFLLLALALAMLLRTFVAAVFTIPSQSMMPGLMVGDMFVATRWDYGLSPYSISERPLFSGRIAGTLPRRGDVVILAGVHDPDTTYIKRVMGLPGDLVEMRAGMVVINGHVLPQRHRGIFLFPIKPGVMCLAFPPLIDLRAPMPDGSPGCHMLLNEERMPDGTWHPVLDYAVAHSDFVAPQRVPPGSVWLLGDNRDDSLDSRFPVSSGGLGMVPLDRIMGRARFIMWSWDGTQSLTRPWSWPAASRTQRIGRIR